MIAIFRDRKFQLWEYKVSHGSLLIRSPKSPSETNNIDLIFVGVEFVQLPRHLDGIVIEEGNKSDLALSTKLKLRSTSKVFVISSAGERHLIAAAAIKICENEVDIFDSPFV
jgi:hypothetical protein